MTETIEKKPRPAANRHVSAGPAALREAEKLLGLGEGKAWKLDGLCVLKEDEIRFGLISGEHRLVLHLSPRTSGLELDDETPLTPATRKLAAALSARLKTKKAADFVKLVAGDPLSFAEDVRPDADGDAIKVPCVGQPLDLLELGWRNFYADQDFEVYLGVPEASQNGMVNIQYADLECYYARPRLSFRKWSFLDWPEECGDEARLERIRGGEELNLVAELEERDMIMGTGERADALVSEVAKHAKQGKYLILTHLCTPIVMGEDFQGLARRCEKECGGTAVRWSQKDRDENDNFGEHFRSLLGQPGFFDAPADPLAVNLFHFPRQARQLEVIPFLNELGIKVNISCLPDVEFPVLPDLPKALWQVFCERSSYPTKIKGLLDASPRKVLAVRAPWGLERTRSCLSTIASALGKTADFERIWKTKHDKLAPEWERMKSQAADCRLGFVVSEATLPRLLELRYGHGAPVGRMAAEMGFGIDLVYYDLHGRPPNLPKEFKDAKVSVFRAPWELQKALAESGAQAFYSDVFFDWRLSRAGKARFSGKDFEMGLEGAVRSFRRLLNVCRMPFYRRYAAELAQDDGRRS